MHPRIPSFGAIDRRDALQALIITTALFCSVFLVAVTYASTVTLSIVVNTSITFTSTTNNFSTITPGTAVFATTTLVVATNDAAGYNITLSGDNKATGQNNLQLSGETTTQITDQTEWVPGAATTSAGNAVRIGSFVNSGDVLAFRVMSASSTNGAGFLATSWWGTADTYVDNANTLWAGISSTTVSRQIGNAGTGSYSSSPHINTALYYLDVSATQKTGTYTAPITYTATGN